MIKLYNTSKFQAWCKRFLDKNDTKCYLNATQSALAVYQLTRYQSACQIGYENITKLEFSLKNYLEEQGYGLKEFMRIGLSKMIEGSFADWEDMMVILGYTEPKNNRQFLKKYSRRQFWKEFTSWN